MLVFWIDIMEIILLQYNNFMSWGSNKLNRDVEQGIIHWKFNKSGILYFLVQYSLKILSIFYPNL